jgi:hypothetical protein
MHQANMSQSVRLEAVTNETWQTNFSMKPAMRATPSSSLGKRRHAASSHRTAMFSAPSYSQQGWLEISCSQPCPPHLGKTVLSSLIGRVLQGTERFKKIAADCKGGVISGRDVFLLWDTFGFPPDLTEVSASSETQPTIPGNRCSLSHVVRLDILAVRFAELPVV